MILIEDKKYIVPVFYMNNIVGYLNTISDIFFNIKDDFLLNTDIWSGNFKKSNIQIIKGKYCYNPFSPIKSLVVRYVKSYHNVVNRK